MQFIIVNFPAMQKEKNVYIVFLISSSVLLYVIFSLGRTSHFCRESGKYNGSRVLLKNFPGLLNLTVTSMTEQK